MSQALYRKWRPSRWEEIAGQDHIVQTIQNAVKAGKEGHAYLFAGPRGTGKTSLARILAKAVNCLDTDLSMRPCNQCEHCAGVNQGSFLDLIEIDAASNTSVEDVRSLRDKINFSPNQGRYKVYIIDEVHMLSTAAFNALLKTLEEPPAHAIFVLATTEVHKIPATVLSRCQRHEFRRIPAREIIELLKSIASEEGYNVEDEVLRLIARQATGGMRDAISLLDQLSSIGNQIDLNGAQLILGTATSQSVLDLIEAMVQKAPADGLRVLQTALDSGTDPRQFSRQIIDYLRSVTLVGMGLADQVDTDSETRQALAKHAAALETRDLLQVIRLFNEADLAIRNAWQPSLPLELALVESVALLEGDTHGSPIPKSGGGEGAIAPEKAMPRSSAVPPQKVETGAADQPVNQLTRKQWEAMLEAVKTINPITCGLLNSSKTKTYHRGVLCLGFPSQLLKEKMEQEEHKTLVEQSAAQIFQNPVKIECIISNAKKGALPPQADHAGMVATGVRLGGEVVDVNPLTKKPQDTQQS